MNTWPQLSAPIFGGDNFRIAQEMSAKWAERGADFEAAREYAMGEGPQEVIQHYADRRG